jgi:hypothetical protein
MSFKPALLVVLPKTLDEFKRVIANPSKEFTTKSAAVCRAIGIGPEDKHHLGNLSLGSSFDLVGVGDRSSKFGIVEILQGLLGVPDVHRSVLPWLGKSQVVLLSKARDLLITRSSALHHRLYLVVR